MLMTWAAGLVTGTRCYRSSVSSLDVCQAVDLGIQDMKLTCMLEWAPYGMFRHVSAWYGDTMAG
eukprot:151325-Chlamydomonas_euryale.AAC.6